MASGTRSVRYVGFLTILIVCALLLTARIAYLFLADPHRFPINRVKITANYEHITHNQLEGILSESMNASFFSLPVRKLQNELLALDWTERVSIERIWPDTLKISLVEKVPVAMWNDSLMTEQGELFNIGTSQIDSDLPRLSGPQPQKSDVLQIYQKLSKLLEVYGLHAASLQLRDNQAWELSLTNGVQLRLGKKDLEKRLQRFCRAYPMVFAERQDRLLRVDLRYARGMAVKWKEAPK